jgi:signal peptidase I
MTKAWRGRLSAAFAILSLVVLLPLAAFLVSVWLLGWQLQSVQSGSMAPTYPVGSLLVIAPIDASRVETGMPIVFVDPELPGRLVAHRVVNLAPGTAVAFLTQGDANATRDPFPVPARNVRGYVQWHITGLGTLMDYLQWPNSFILLVVLPAALLVATEARTRLRGARFTSRTMAVNQRLVAISHYKQDQA